MQKAASNLERAAEELAAAATEEVASRAATLLDQAARRVREGADGAGASDSAGAHDESPRGRRSRHVHYRDYEDLSRRSRDLYLDRENRKIVGVCAGIARYFGIEAWVARCAALTGLIFLPSIVFPAYWIAFFVMGRAPTDRSSAGKPRCWVGRIQARERADATSSRANETNETNDRRSAARRGRRTYNAPSDHRSPAPEFGSRFSPRRSLRATKADFAEVELRLRRMEAFVTSDKYALDREIEELKDG